MTGPSLTLAAAIGRRLPPAAVRELGRRLRRAARRMGVPAADIPTISVHVVDDPEIQRLNLTHMGHDKPTDVLSFPARTPEGPPGVGLGDIVLSWDAVLRQAAGRPPLDEATVLVVHGLAHLLGHDHAGRRDGRAMLRHERRGLAAARVADIPRPYGQR